VICEAPTTTAAERRALDIEVHQWFIDVLRVNVEAMENLMEQVDSLLGMPNTLDEGQREALEKASAKDQYTISKLREGIEYHEQRLDLYERGHL